MHISLCVGFDLVDEEAVKEVANDRVPVAQEEPTKKSKDKKRMKKNAVPETYADTAEKEKSESVHVETLKSSKGTEPSEDTTVHEEAGKKSKDRKKKKNKEKLESVATISDDTTVSRDSQAADSIGLNGNVATLEEKVGKSKTKKRKGSQHLSDENSNQLTIESSEGTVNKNDGTKTIHEDEHNDNSKKRKRLASEDHDSHTVDEKETEDVKRRKLEGSKGCSDGVQTNEYVEKTAKKTSTKKALKKHSNDSTEVCLYFCYAEVKFLHLRKYFDDMTIFKQCNMLYAKDIEVLSSILPILN